MRSWVGRPEVLLGLAGILAIAAFQLWIDPSNPPGFHRDEAGLALNAYTLSEDARDEDGARMPLFFRSFDDYKSPLYPYLLAGVFFVTGPDAGVARGFSAVLVLAAVLLLGLLAWRLSGRAAIALLVVALAGLTPWLFELGRVAIEANTQPLLIVLLLLWLEKVVRQDRYGVVQGVLAGGLVALLTYSYTGSRLLGPLLAVAMVVFGGSGRWRFVLSAWGAFVVALVPIGVYALRHPGALTARYEATTIARDGLSGLPLVAQAIANWANDINPWHWATGGDPAPYIHVGGYGALFAAVVMLAFAGAAVVLVRERDDRFWRFVLVAVLLVPIPAALTVDRVNAIRLAALPVFVLVLAIPALDALLTAVKTSRLALVVAGALGLLVVAQFALFLGEYRERGPGRVALFEAGVKGLLRPAFDSGETVYVDFDDRGAKTKARWHAVEAGVPADRVVQLADGGIPPDGSLVLSLFQECDFTCDEVGRWEGYRLSRARTT